MWWPNGAGQQKLYNLNVKWEDRKINTESHFHLRKFSESSKTVKIGFRTIELVQDKMDNGLSFFFKVNNVPIFMKGEDSVFKRCYLNTHFVISDYFQDQISFHLTFYLKNLMTSKRLATFSEQRETQT